MNPISAHATRPKLSVASNLISKSPLAKKENAVLDASGKSNRVFTNSIVCFLTLNGHVQS